jgi:type IV pilus assembly protein PilC
MPVYTCKIVHSDGSLRSGRYTAGNSAELKRRLADQGLDATSITRQLDVRERLARLTARSITPTDIAVMCRQLSIMTQAGLSITQTMKALIADTCNLRLRHALERVHSDLRRGIRLSAAFGNQPTVFSQLFVGMVQAGEACGKLAETVNKLATLLEADAVSRRKFISAAVNPGVVFLLSLAIIVLVSVFITPRMMQLFKDMGIKDFPLITLAVASFSDFLITRWLAIVTGGMVIYSAFKAIVSTELGYIVVERLKLVIPVFGKLHQNFALAQFCRTLGAQLSSGVPVLTAFENVAGTVANCTISAAVMDARERIRQGASIADGLRFTRQFPIVVVNMVAVGEETAQMDVVLEKLADEYERRVETTRNTIAAITEPVLMIVTGLIVLVIVLALFVPLMPDCSCLR